MEKIKSRLDSSFKGSVLRVGGSVSQLLNYSKVTVTDLNLPDGGFGSLKTFSWKQNPYNNLKCLLKWVKQEIKFFRFGNQVSRDRNTLVMDLHHATMNPSLQRRFDWIISSNVIEHSPNPIAFLLNASHAVKEEGFHFHAIPHCEHTFDRYRTPTSREHLVEDFLNKTDFSDQSHNEDYIQSAIEKDGWQKDFHKKYPVAYPYMHFHVFNEENVRELFETLFEDVQVSFLKTSEHSDILVLCSNKLRPEFKEEFADLISSYQKEGLPVDPNINA